LKRIDKSKASGNLLAFPAADKASGDLMALRRGIGHSVGIHHEHRDLNGSRKVKAEPNRPGVADIISQRELRDLSLAQRMAWGITEGIEQKLEAIAERFRCGAVVESDEHFDLVQKQQIKLRGPKRRTREEGYIFET